MLLGARVIVIPRGCPAAAKPAVAPPAKAYEREAPIVVDIVAVRGRLRSRTRPFELCRHAGHAGERKGNQPKPSGHGSIMLDPARLRTCRLRAAAAQPADEGRP